MVANISLQEINAKGSRVIRRTENYADSHKGFNGLLRGEKLLGLLRELSGEPMNLFKEKINYKLAGSGENCDLYLFTFLAKAHHVL
jgi:hypothetical protein